ncbi:MAG: ketoacyl-ACP synthase III [Actinomycetia bacterium]|nr:ketoacyl-ACP synthase III [Actinomycetes bacterium]
MSNLRAVVVGLGTYTPARILTNAELEQRLDTSDEWITSRTGIRERRIAGPGETASTMGAAAVEAALTDAGLPVEAIDWWVCATNTGDTVFPSTAGRILAHLGAPPRPAFDVQAGCTGFVYGLELAANAIAAGSARRAVVVGTDVLSAITDWEDRQTAVLFGDGAGAVVLEGRPGDRGILASYLNCDGTGGPFLMLPAGGSAMPASVETVAHRQHYLKMSGREVFKFAVRALPDAVEQVLSRAGLDLADLDLLVPHQANRRIIEAAVERFGLAPEQVVVNIERYGNTSVASIPLALADARADGRLRDGRLVVVAAFGAGLTWGAAAIRWGR